MPTETQQANLPTHFQARTCDRSLSFRHTGRLWRGANGREAASCGEEKVEQKKGAGLPIPEDERNPDCSGYLATGSRVGFTGSVGFLVNGTEARIVDEDGKDVEPGQEGEV